MYHHLCYNIPPTFSSRPFLCVLAVKIDMSYTIHDLAFSIALQYSPNIRQIGIRQGKLQTAKTIFKTYNCFFFLLKRACILQSNIYIFVVKLLKFIIVKTLLITHKNLFVLRYIDQQWNQEFFILIRIASCCIALWTKWLTKKLDW